MKKLIFLLVLAVVFAGVVFAVETTHPPWTPEAVMSEFGVESYAVTLDTVPVTVLPELVAGVYLAMPDTKMYNTGQPKRSSMYNLARETRRHVDEILSAYEIGQGYWLRL
jgi:hypothetical protein